MGYIMISRNVHNYLRTYISALGDADIPVICWTAQELQYSSKPIYLPHLPLSAHLYWQYDSTTYSYPKCLQAQERRVTGCKALNSLLSHSEGRLDSSFFTRYEAWWPGTHLWSQFYLSQSSSPWRTTFSFRMVSLYSQLSFSTQTSGSGYLSAFICNASKEPWACLNTCDSLRHGLLERSHMVLGGLPRTSLYLCHNWCGWCFLHYQFLSGQGLHSLIHAKERA